MITFRPFQTELKNNLYASWDRGSTSTILVAPTGAGKTVIMAGVAREVNEPMVSIAHRQELVQQISMAMTQQDQPHNLIAPNNVVNIIIREQINMCGMSYFDRRAPLTVAGVGTLRSRADKLAQWANTVRYWQGDECHHFLQNNQWGKAVDMFPNARGVGFTASPIRCDRRSLHRDQGGCFDDMVVGPSPRELIDQGYLCDYRIFGPPQSISTDGVKVSKSTGEFTAPSLKVAADKSTITGDVVEHYLKIAPGKQGITFAVDVEGAQRIAEAYRQRGVAAEAVDGNTPDAVRNQLVDKFKRGIIQQLVNVDLFGEGFDVPATEVVSFARPTQSFGLYLQQFGRALRLAPGKTHGIIIDHVGNVKRHGLPDAVRNWTLLVDGSGRRSAVIDPNVVPVTTCLECFRAYEAITKTCPYCGHVHEPESRSAPEFVDGDLVEFSPELLEQLRSQAEAIAAPFDPQTDVPMALRGTPAERNIAKNYGNTQLGQHALRETIALWAGVRRDKGMSDSEIYRRFYHRFGVDIATAQTIKKLTEIERLTASVKEGYWA